MRSMSTSCSPLSERNNLMTRAAQAGPGLPDRPSRVQSAALSAAASLGRRRPPKLTLIWQVTERERNAVRSRCNFS